MPLPDTLISDVTRLLLPHMGTVDERDAWLTQAFYTAERRLYQQISREGAPVVFTTRCIKTLLDVGCLPDGKHALAVLLDALRLVYGVQEHAVLDRLVQQLDALCVEARPEQRPGMPAALPALPVQTIHTPADQRTPTVFVSYSHTDKPFVERLIADLQAAGHACWIDTTDIKGGDEWTHAITEGINNSYAFVTIVSQAANGSRWVQREYLWAEGKQKVIFPVLAEVCDLPIYMVERQSTAFHQDYAAGLSDLLRALPTPTIGNVPVVQLTHPTNPRALELDYLDYLRLNELVHTEKYTPLAGTAHIHARPVPHGRAVEPVVIRPEFEHLRRRVDDDQPGEIETRKFEDIIGAMGDIQRAVVLGEPGAGKTTTLWKLARNLVDAAQADPTAPIPVLVRLGRWTNPDQPLLAFIAGELGRLGAHLDTLLSSERAVLLLDGLNEIPVAQREAKARQVRDLFTEHPALSAVVTCREQDYTLDLGVDRILITPLDPLRIREFVTRYLGDEQGEALFWRLAGERAYEYEEEFRMTFADLNPDWEHVFWSWREEILPEGFDWRKVDHERHVVWLRWEDWLLVRDNLGSLMNLARNPYMLLMMTDVYAHNGDLPANRGELFKRFVGTLLAREHITEGAAVLLQALAVLAYEMQVQRGQYQSGSAVTVLPRPAAARFLDERQFYQASSASLLSVDDEVRFTHQLLQEYFAATHMRAEIEAGRLTASFLWSRDRWWLRTNWEEAAVLLTGLYSADCSRVVDWMAVANPEVAALCITRSGAHTPPETLERLRVAWIPRLTDLEHDPQPEARAAVGRALGLLNLDNRPGVGLRPDGLPDIDWVEIREGPFRYQKKEWLTLPTFYISRYPITYRQFQAFIDAPDGFYNPCWWEGLAADDGHRSAPGEQAFKFWNHPRERVSWYDAVAFCRWLSAQLDDVVRLPTEQEWEKAACGTNGRKYPWGNDYIQGYANIDENYDNTGPHYLQQTSAVGIYPQGASPYGVMDMAGNVWEWCLNEYNYPENTVLTGDAARVGRGGAWTYYEFYARCVFRYRRYPDPRSDFIGFRVCVVAHPIL